MANNISHISQETAEEALFKVETQAKEPNLTKEQLTQWFANLEKHEDPKTTLSAPDLATQLLSRFGLQNAEQVMEFLGTESGKITFTMISRELMHEEAINKYLVEKNQEELLRQRKVLFVLLGLITSRDAEAKEVGYRIQEQIQKILKDNNAQNEKSKVKIPLLSPVAIVQAMIKTYNEAIEALDEQIVEVNAHITELDTELEELAQEAVHIQQHHDGLDTHMAVLNAYLKLPIFHTMPNNPHAYAQEQLIALGNKQKKIQAKIDNTQSENPDFERKNRMKLVVIQRLSDFHQEVALRHVPENEHPFTFETAVKLFMEQLRKAQKEGQQFGRYDTAMEGLKLQESGLSQVLKVKLNKKVYLNAQLEVVDNHEQARFVVDLNEKDHYLKKGNEYYFLPRPKGEIDIEKMSKAEWALAKNAFLEKKPDILSVHARHKEQIEVHVGEHTQRINERKDLRLVLMKQLSDLRYAKEDMKGKLTQAKEEEARLLGAPMNKAPTPQPRPQQEHDAKENVYIPKPMPQPGHRSSYSRMMEAFEGLVLTQSPHNKEALEKANALVKEAPTAHQGELKALIGEIKPNMDSNLRLSWLFRAKELISNITPEPDSTSTLDRKGK